MIEVTTVAGNVWTGRRVNTDTGVISIITPGGIGYSIPRFRIKSIREV